ncbi:MAG: H4MPT-linked C1 transfer pathway protein [Gammaproteobacteria bacterium]|nr:H4MPT-linked C1 transfer pathway protein [Gammaproteobacteria bacterium]
MSVASNFVGWDIGGAHLKMVKVDGQGNVLQAKQYATPIWQGLEILKSLFEQNKNLHTSDNEVHALTITGELSDIFDNRKDGVEALLSVFASVYQNTESMVYCGESGFLAIAESIEKHNQAASANWHATASYLALQNEKFVLIDIGSTTTDLILVDRGRVINKAYTDQERMREASLVYTGFTRTPVMAVVNKVQFEGVWQSIAAEFFATMADVYRITGELHENQDLMPAADGGKKTREASIRRLARMLGADALEYEDQDRYLPLAHYIAAQQLKTIEENLDQMLRHCHYSLAKRPDIVGAGTGRHLARKLAEARNYAYIDIESLISGNESLFAKTGDCAAALAVAQLARVKLKL